MHRFISPVILPLWIICLCLSLVAFTAPYPAHATNNAETLRLLDLFGDVFEKVREEYVEEREDKELIEAAINGMLTALDPHSSYLNNKAFDEMKIQTKGEFGGLGIEVTMDKGLIKVVSPIDDTPAFKAGILAGDYITHIDDESVLGMTLNEAVDKMRGKVGTKIVVTIAREGLKEPLQVHITRDVIRIKSVRARQEKDIAYIRITSFSEKTVADLKKRLIRLKKDIGKDLKGIVLDLRNNPGGLLEQAIEVSDVFLDKGEIVSTRGRVPESTKRFNASPGDLTNGLPVVVLINEGSASASEIVAGALQDHKRGIIMGTKSFGKGSVQTVIPLPGRSAMRLTTSRYYTPSGKSIQAEGIEPDIIVEQAKIQLIKNGKKNAEANLRGHLENVNHSAEDNEEGEEGENNNGSSKDAKTTKEKSLQERDYQLSRAVDLLRGMSFFKYKNE